ncbi:hypothetical protein LF1_55520 [Rubripirellula obstinata]|uniref:Uncharacterized protein n=1 Tax=Rubripirellula obstinata TaxID=406547 RepID=A0A5B1CA53_9BACT|nr:hypothetical protein LF1_55520 [Rubripirellula obstinata]
MNQHTHQSARRGKGRLQWEPGGWFGGIIGGSSWLAFGSLALLWRGELFPSFVSGVSWLLVLSLACWLWVRRDRIDPFHGLAYILILLSVLMPIVWFVCWDIPTDRPMPSLHWIRGFRSAAACSIAPVILACFFARERILIPKPRTGAHATHADGSPGTAHRDPASGGH